jgi:hypothetical protein
VQATSEPRASKPALKGVRGAAISLALLLCACAKVNVTPLGSTRDGRRQFEITCNKSATDGGSCNEKALALCGGSYETQGLGRAAAATSSYDGQLVTPPADRVLLIACNR